MKFEIRQTSGSSRPERQLSSRPRHALKFGGCGRTPGKRCVLLYGFRFSGNPTWKTDLVRSWPKNKAVQYSCKHTEQVFSKYENSRSHTPCETAPALRVKYNSLFRRYCAAVGSTKGLHPPHMADLTAKESAEPTKRPPGIHRRTRGLTGIHLGAYAVTVYMCT